MSSLRVSQANSFSSSPIMPHKCDNYGPIGLEASDILDSTFIRPLPCGQQKGSSLESRSKVQQNSNHDESRTIILDPVPAPRKSLGKKADDERKKNEDKKSPERASTSVLVQRTMPSVIRTSGHTPSRSTSARLPPRNDLINQVQRNTRHTIK